MPAIDDDVIEVAIIHDNTTSGEQVNNYQFQLTSGGPVDDADLLDDVALILQVLYLIIAAYTDIRNVLREVVVRNKTQGLLVGSTDAGTYLGGTNISDATPQGVAPYVYFKTNVPRVVLSKYLPSVGEGSVSADGRLTTAFQAVLLSYAVTLAATHAVGGHTYEYGYDSPKALGFVLPSVLVVANVYAYQRRRKEGRGS